MHWYGGTMAEAVNLSKQRNAIFVVFVEGDNDLSKELADTIDNSIVLKRLTDPNNFLAVKLKSGSENYTYFAQIYQFVPVPSLFFIGRNGTPLEVVCAGVEPQSLATRIDRILQEHRKLVFGKEDKNPLPQPSTSAQNIRDETINFIQSEASQSTAAQKVEKPDETEKLTQAKESSPLEPKVTATKNVHADEPESSAPAAKIAKTEETSNIEYEVVCDGDVCVRRPKDQGGPSSVEDKPQESVQETESASNVQDKMERAKELIEARRKEKAAKEKEEERQKEMERRAVGQGVAELKKWQAEQELKQLQEERKREKLENDLARQRILEQIAQDRAERKAREQPAAAPSPQPPSGAVPAPAVGDVAGRARVQFKLPGGAAHTAHFDAAAPLAALHDYLADNLQLPASNFSLWIPFPRRELTERNASLRELQLAPSAALLVLPRREIEPATPSTFGGVIAFLTQLFTSMVLDPTYQVYSWLRNRLFSNPPPNPSPNPTNPVNPANSSNPVNPANPSGLRRRGNIHRLNGDRSGEDDNNTWNGNSTQQM